MFVGPAALRAAAAVLAYNASPVLNKVNQNDTHFPVRAVLPVYNGVFTFQKHPMVKTPIGDLTMCGNFLITHQTRITTKQPVK